jgi:hypothetical protein
VIDEGNPVAAWVLRQGGWPALAAYKGVTVVLVAGAVGALTARRPRAGRAVLAFGCTAVAAVVAYSTFLLGSAGGLGAQAAAHDTAANARRRALEAERHRIIEFQQRRSEVVRDLLADRCDLSEAVDRMMQTQIRHDAVWLNRVRANYGLESERACFAAVVIAHARYPLRHDPALLARRMRDWLDAYQARSHISEPSAWQRLRAVFPDSAI